jgi:hypothetical protein
MQPTVFQDRGEILSRPGGCGYPPPGDDMGLQIGSPPPGEVRRGLPHFLTDIRDLASQYPTDLEGVPSPSQKVVEVFFHDFFSSNC